MSATSRLLRSLVVVIVVTAVAIGAAVYLGKRDLTVPAPSPVASGISAHAKDLRTVPDVSRDARRATAREIAYAVERVYTAAFTRPIAAQSSSPPPGSARRVRDLFTTGAIAALKKSTDVFDLGPLVVTAGTANFSGVVTYGGKDTAKDALIEIDFVGRATPAGATEPAVRVHQRGTLGLRRNADGWLVRSFDLRLATRPEPTPKPRV
jgi:hypothetical protein